MGGRGRPVGLSSGLPHPGVDTPGPKPASLLPRAPKPGGRRGEPPLTPKLQPRTHVDLEAPGEAEDKGHQDAGEGTGGGTWPSLGGGAQLRRTPNQGGPPGRSDGGSQGGLRAGVTEPAGIRPGRVV